MLLEAHNLSKSYQENQEPILRPVHRHYGAVWLREIHSSQSFVHH